MSVPPPRVTGIILAAGMASRFGAAKQLALVSGQPLVRLVAEQAARSRLDDVIVVTGHAAADVCRAVEGLRVRVVANHAFADGQSTSVRAGLEAVSDTHDAAMFLVCDQPGLTAGTIDHLLEVFVRTRAPMVVPVAEGRRGSPVIFARALFDELRALRGDTGGRPVIAAHPQDVVEVEVPVAALRDIDTPADLVDWNRNPDHRSR